MVEIDRRKAALIAELEVSRGELRGALRGCESALNPANLLRRSVKDHSALWLSGATVLGVVFSRILAGSGRSHAPPPSSSPSAAGAKGWIPDMRPWSLLKLALDFVRPTLVEWIASFLTRQIQKNAHPNTYKSSESP